MAERVVREIVIQGRAEGLDQLSTSVSKLDTTFAQTSQSALAMARASETATNSQLTAARAFDRIRASTDQAFASSQKFAAGQTAADRALRLGVVSAQEHASVLEGLARKHGLVQTANDNLQHSLGSNRATMLELGHVAKATFESLASGAPLMTVLAQQGASTAQAFSMSPKGVAGTLQDAASSAVGLLSKITPTIGAFTVLGATVGATAAAYSRFSENQRELSLGLAGSARASGATVGQVNAIADANAGPGLSAQSIRELSVEFAKTGKIGAETFGSLSHLTHDYAVLTGQDLQAAGRDVAQAFAAQSAGALDLNKQVGGLSGSTYQLIQRLESMGDRAGAQRVMVLTFSESLKAAAENAGLLSKAWEAVKTDFSEGADAIGKAVSMAVQGGVSLEQRLETAQHILESSRSRSWIPVIGQRDVQSAQSEVDRLKAEIEKQRRLTEEGVTGAKTLAGAQALEKLSPTMSDLLGLQKYASQLREALDTGKSVTGTEDALRRVNELLKAGGQAAYDLKRSARDAFDQAGMLPFQKSQAAITSEFGERLKAPGLDPRARQSIEEARDLQLKAARVGAVDVPLRDANRAITEQTANLKVQRDSFLAGTEAAAAMAAKQDLVNSSARQGVDIMKENGAAVEAYAKRAGAAAKATEEFQRSRDRIIGGMDELRSGTSGMLTGAFSDLRQGKSPLDGIVKSLGRMTDQYFDRMVSKPLTESLFGMTGKAGGGLFGDDISKAFGSITTASATVNAATVVVNGGIGSGGGMGGLPGLPTAQGSSAVQQGATLAAGSAGRVSVRLGSGGEPDSATTQTSLPSPSNVIPFARPSIAAQGASPITQASLPAPSSVLPAVPQRITPVPGYVEGYDPTTAQRSLVSVLPPRNPELDTMAAAVRARDMDRAGGFAGSAPRQDIMDRMAGPMASKASEMARASEQAASSLDKLGSSSDGAAGALSKIADRLPTSSGGPSGINFGGGGLGAGSGSGGDFDFSSGAGGEFFATGGIMTSRGRLPLNRYAKGGVANSPQVAVFGEGRGPEAYVPLPDGKSIPVSMQLPVGMPANGNTAPAVNITHNPVYQVTPANGVTPEQLGTVIERNNKEFVRSLPGHLAEIRKRSA